MRNGYFMRVVAYQLTQNKKYKLAVRSANKDYRIIVVEDIHGLKDALQDVHIVEGSDIDSEWEETEAKLKAIQLTING